MKMQKAEMELVTFDAQDVIATSGPGTPLGYFASSVRGALGGDPFNGSEDFFLLGDVDGKNCYIDKEGLSASPYYIINSAEYYIDDKWNDINYILDTTDTRTEPTGSGYKKLEDAGAILSWLMGIATKQQ